MNEQLLQEVPLSAPAEVRLIGVVNPPIISMPLVTTFQFIAPIALSQPQSFVQVDQDMDADL